MTVADIAAARARMLAREAAAAGDLTHERLTRGETAAADDPRPLVAISPDLAATVDQALAALARDPELYQRGGALVRVVHEAEPGERVAMAPGAPRVVAMSAGALRERLARVARWARLDRKGSHRATRPDADTVAALLGRGEWPRVRPLRGIVEAPFLRPDGTIFDAAGYDPITGYLYEPSADFGRIGERPTRDDAHAAVAALAGTFSDFPWTGAAAQGAAIAGVLTLLARPAIAGPVPALVIDANCPGTGKSLIADVIALIATGRPAPRMSWPPDSAEVEKCLGAYALRAASLVCFDNVGQASPFGGAPLDKVLTAEDVVELRILGRSEVPAIQWRAMIIATGNQVSVVGDTARRVLLARLETNLERPQDRSGFRISDLRGWVRANRPRLVVAALTILRAYCVAGRPPAGLRPWGSFEAWTGLVAGALAWAVPGLDILDARLDAAPVADPEILALCAILAHWPAEGGTLRAIVERFYPGGRDPMRAEGAELREAFETLAPPTSPGFAPSTARLGRALRKHAGRVLGGRKLTSATDRKGFQLWRVEVLP